MAFRTYKGRNEVKDPATPGCGALRRRSPCSLQVAIEWRQDISEQERDRILADEARGAPKRSSFDVEGQW